MWGMQVVQVQEDHDELIENWKSGQPP